jgi:hypothetical protein
MLIFSKAKKCKWSRKPKVRRLKIPHPDWFLPYGHIIRKFSEPLQPLPDLICAIQKTAVNSWLPFLLYHLRNR